MRDSINIWRIRNHISILQEEKKVAKELEEYLLICYKQASLEGWENMEFIEKQLRIASSQVENIQRRILLLETIIDKFGFLLQEIAEVLADAKDTIKSQ